jgi:class 3 adenylate cyclase
MAAKASKAKKGTQRKLTAILCADVVGYSRLMGAPPIQYNSALYARIRRRSLHRLVGSVPPHGLVVTFQSQLSGFNRTGSRHDET